MAARDETLALPRHAKVLEGTLTLRVGADDDDAYTITPAFILETVQAAKGFISESVPVVTGRHGTNAENHLQVQISKFLDWPRTRVKDALAQLNAIEWKEDNKSDRISLSLTPEVF